MAQQKIHPTDLVNLGVAVEEAFDRNATIECVWKHGSDPNDPTFYAVVNNGSTANAFVPCTITIADVTTGGGAASDDDAGTPIPSGRGQHLSVDQGAAVAASYTAVTALVTANGTITP